MDTVAVRIGEADLPREIANLRLPKRRDAPSSSVSIDGESVTTLEVQRHSVAEHAGSGHLLAARVDGFLEHEGGAAKGHPAPTQAAVRDPAVLYSESEAINVEGQ